jgi:hypothetical protein
MAARKTVRDPGTDQAEADAFARAELTRFEADPGQPVGAGTTAAGYVRATSPEGVAVTFVPGEALPDWAAEALRSGSASYDAETRAWVLP